MIKVDEERGAIVVHGSVPGKPGNVLEITPAKIVGKTWKYQRWGAHAGCCSFYMGSGAVAALYHCTASRSLQTGCTFTALLTVRLCLQESGAVKGRDQGEV